MECLVVFYAQTAPHVTAGEVSCPMQSPADDVCALQLSKEEECSLCKNPCAVHIVIVPRLPMCGSSVRYIKDMCRDNLTVYIAVTAEKSVTFVFYCSTHVLSTRVALLVFTGKLTAQD